MATRTHTRISRRSLLTGAAGATAGWLARPRSAFAAQGGIVDAVASSLEVQPNTFYKPRPASKAELGMNAGPVISQLEALKDAGVDYVRFQPGWIGIEDYETGALSLPSRVIEALQFMSKNNMHPVIVHAYGPPNERVTQLQVAADVPVGSYTIPVSNPIAIKVPRDYVTLGCPHVHRSEFITEPFYCDYGSLIASAAGSTITLAAKLARSPYAPTAPPGVGLMAGEKLNVFRLRYAPIRNLDPNEPQVQAYMRAGRFTAEQIVAHGCTGYVCLWNEYPYPPEKWPNLYGSYELATRPPDVIEDKGMAAILRAALEATHLPPGVNWINGASDKSGRNSILLTFKEVAGLLTAARVNGWREGMHCYDAFSPEAGAGWDDELHLINRAVDRYGNFIDLARFARNSGFDIGPIATECGMMLEDPVKQARSDLRRVASLWGMGVVPFLGLMQTPTGGPAYEALQRLTALKNSLGPGGSAASAPTVAGISGAAWPIMSVALYGEHGAVLLVWQRTWIPPVPGTHWGELASPPPASIKVALGAAQNVLSVQNLRSGESLPTELASVPVADDPIAIRVA